MNSGIVKWFRFDGIGYIICNKSNRSLLVDSSCINPNSSELTIGAKVKFEQKEILGQLCAINVEVINE